MKPSFITLILLITLNAHAQNEEKARFEYTSFQVIYTELGDVKVKGKEEPLKQVNRYGNQEKSESNNDLSISKTVDKTMESLGKEGFELVTTVQYKTQDGLNVIYYFKRRIMNNN
jgi:hypothetical protein